MYKNINHNIMKENGVQCCGVDYDKKISVAVEAGCRILHCIAKDRYDMIKKNTGHIDWYLLFYGSGTEVNISRVEFHSVLLL